MKFSDLIPEAFEDFLAYAKTQLQIELLDLKIWYLKRKWSFVLIQQGKKELRTGEDGLFPLTITLIAKMAYADSKLSHVEHQSVEELLRSTLKLEDHQVILALEYFRRARSSKKSFKTCAEEFYARFYKSQIILENTIDILLALALADGRIDEDERKILQTALVVFHLSEQVYNNLRNTRLQIHALKKKQEHLKEAQVEYEEKDTIFRDSSSFSQKTKIASGTSESSLLENYYRVLDCKPSDSMQTIKSSYRKLVMKYHPDRFSAEGVSEEMRAFSLQRFREIQSAYDQICKRK